MKTKLQYVKTILTYEQIKAPKKLNPSGHLSRHVMMKAKNYCNQTLILKVIIEKKAVL